MAISPRLCLAFDPGSDGALALVHNSGGLVEPFTLKGLWSIYGAEGGWTKRLLTALEEAHEIIRGADCGTVSVCETMPPTTTKRHAGLDGGRGRFADDTSGIRTALGLGRYQGQFIALSHVLDLPRPRLIEVGDWTGGLRLSPKKLQGALYFGEHRLREAVRLCPSASPALLSIPTKTQADKKRLIDAAEAVLMACYGGLNG